jgi:Flp pilus assembly protein TadG
MIRALLKKLRRDQRGLTIVEFALIAPVLFTMLLGTFDLSYNMYFRNLMDGVLEEAARRAAVGGVSSTETDTYITTQVKKILPASQRNNSQALKIKKLAYTNFSDVGKPEKITADTAPLGEINVGDCFIDSNGNGTYDLDRGASGQGGADDIVFYEVTASFPRLFPLSKLLGLSATNTVKTNTLIRNQPFAEQDLELQKCKK